AIERLFVIAPARRPGEPPPKAGALGRMTSRGRGNNRRRHPARLCGSNRQRASYVTLWPRSGELIGACCQRWQPSDAGTVGPTPRWAWGTGTTPGQAGRLGAALRYVTLLHRENTRNLFVRKVSTLTPQLTCANASQW